MFTAASSAELIRTITRWGNIDTLSTPNGMIDILCNALYMLWVPNTTFLVIAGSYHLSIVDSDSGRTVLYVSKSTVYPSGCMSPLGHPTSANDHELCRSFGEPIGVAITEDGEQLAVIQASWHAHVYQVNTATEVVPDTGSWDFGRPGTVLPGLTLAAPPASPLRLIS